VVNRRDGFGSLYLSPLHHLEEEVRKVMETGIKKIIVIRETLVLEPVAKPF
jgi:hypothetical protein